MDFGEIAKYFCDAGWQLRLHAIASSTNSGGAFVLPAGIIDLVHLMVCVAHFSGPQLPVEM